MELKIISKKQVLLFNRTEVVAEVSEFAATPSKKEVIALLCKELKCKEEVVVIQEIHQPFGVKKAKVTANIYSSVEDVEKNALKHLLKRMRPAKKEGKTETK